MPSDELKAPTTLHPTPTPSPESVTEPVAPTGPARWYGGSIWATDSLVALSVVPGMLVSLTAQRAGIGMMGVSLAGYLLAPAFVHAAHGNLGRGFLSVAMRAALPLLFGAIGGLAGCSPWNWVCSADGAAAGALVGYASAIVIDMTALAWDHRPRDKPARVAVTPLPTRSTYGLALIGQW